MIEAKQVAEAARKRLREDRTRLKVPQHTVARDGGVPRGTIAYADGSDSRSLSLATFIGYARGLTGRASWRVLRDVEESLFGED